MKKNHEIAIGKLAEEGVFDVNDLMMYIAREEAKHGNGWLAKGLAVPGAVLLPGASQALLVERYVRIAKPYFVTRGIEVKDKDVRKFLARSCATVMVMIWENPKEFLKEYPKVIGATTAEEPEKPKENKEEES